MNNIIESIITIIASSGVTFFFTKKKYKAEVISAEIQNLKEVIEAYRTIIADLKNRVQELSDEVTELKLKNGKN